MGPPALSECFSELGFKAGHEKLFVNSLFKFILHPDHQDFMNEKVNVKSVNRKEMVAGYLDFHGDEFWSEEPSQRSHLTDDAVSYPDDAERYEFRVRYPYQLMNGDEQTFQRLIEEIKAWWGWKQDGGNTCTVVVEVHLKKALAV
ncbi:MAG: hypothetical protein M1835_006258 [Candelina submexicana]|nr:MAG: hypothetical protein M1835_006258 [Candelina submexicana]